MQRHAPAGKEWRLRSPATELAIGGDGVPDVVVQLLRNRGIGTAAELDSFMNPRLHDPALLPDMELACRRLRRALDNRETVGIFGDFDVDGVTGTALMTEALQSLGVKVIPYIPDRVEEGHGLNEGAVLALKDQGVSVLVTVDCGITSPQEIALANELGIDVIVTDHHIPPSPLPPALSVIDPKRADSGYPFQYLSGAGLALKLVQGLYDVVGQPWSRDLLELAALSTVADVVPLRDENRFLVQEGLKELRRTRRPGLQALYRHASIHPESIGVEDISFGIAPRINAAGRLEHASTSFQLLLTKSDEEGDKLAARLDSLNRERRQLSEDAWVRARETVLSWPALPSILLVEDEQLIPGISGLVASRLVDEFHRPSIVMSRVDGVVRASARSIPEFDLVEDALSHCSDLFIRHGGHSQAAGFQMDPQHLANLRQRLEHAAEEALGGHDLQPALHIDAEVPVATLAGGTFQWIRDLEPFGMENPTPVFLTRNLVPMQARSVGKQGQHLSLKLREGKVVWDAIAFRQWDQWKAGTSSLDVVYTIGTEWRNGTEVLSLKVLDFRVSSL